MRVWMRWTQINLGLLFLTVSLYGAERKATTPSGIHDLNSPSNLALLEGKCKKVLSAAHLQLLRVFYFTQIQGEIRFVVYTKRAAEVPPHIVKKTTTLDQVDLLSELTSYWLDSNEPEKLLGGQPVAIEVLEEPLDEMSASAEMHPPLGHHDSLLHQQLDWRAHLDSSKRACSIL